MLEIFRMKIPSIDDKFNYFKSLFEDILSGNEAFSRKNLVADKTV